MTQDAMAEAGPDEADAASSRSKIPRQQLSNGMEHMRFAVDAGFPKDTSVTTDSNDAYGVPSTFQPMRHQESERRSTRDNPEKRTDPFQFGSRFLQEGDDIFEFNAWDHVETDEEYKQFAEVRYAEQRHAGASDFDKKRFNENPAKWWDKFYGNNASNFFKNRKWLQQEFPILKSVTDSDAPATLLLEVGAGAGNTAFPILAQNRNPRFRIHAVDFSKKAVDVMRSQPQYDTQHMQADVWDLAGEGDESLPPNIATNSVDIVLMIFVFSALAPSQWPQALRNIDKVLKPGGVVLFRDYGRGDLAQIRFKSGRWLQENFYVRGDGTRVYFFEQDELKAIWSGRDYEAQHDTASLGSNPDERAAGATERPIFDIVNSGVDRRMLVNRQRRLKMYRCWQQAVFRKPSTC